MINSPEELERLRNIFEESPYAEPAFMEDLVRESQPEKGTADRTIARLSKVTSTFFSDLANASLNSGVLWPPMGLGLPGKVEIASVYIENHGSSLSVNVFGGSGAGQLYATVTKGTYRVIALPNGIHEANFVAASGTDTGLVLVTLTTERWKPTFGTIV